VTRSPAVDVAVFHHLPTGGALRVVAEWVRRSDADAVTVYTPDASVHAFAGFPAGVRVVTVAEPEPTIGVRGVTSVLGAVPAGRRIARTIDTGGHDAVFVLPSLLTQAPQLLRFLRTPSVYYAPEAMRSAYEDRPSFFRGAHWKMRMTRAGLNPAEQLRKLLDRGAARAARCVVTHSEFTRGDLRAKYGVESRVLRLGVDLDAFRPAPAGDASDAKPSVLSIGALHPLKGHDLVVAAVGTIATEQRPRVVVVGDRGDHGPALVALAARLGVDLDVRSAIPFAQVVQLVQRAAVVACGQLREPFGLVPLEAMACARPVVAVDEGGLRETVRHDHNGLLVARDARAMGDAIGRLLDDAGLRERLGRAGRADVEAHWRWDDYARALDDLLRKRAASAYERGAARASA
jgi:glycosyltransferase involved in cell wall biosynthesis